MKFHVVSEAFEKIEQESSRLTITHLLADLLKEASPSEAAVIAYLSLGDINPTYVGTKFNFAEKGMVRVLANIFGRSESTIETHERKAGDLGVVVTEYEWPYKSKHDLTVGQVYEQLQEFLAISGTGSQELKEKKLIEFLEQLDQVSAKYIVRVIVGKLRLGFSDMTLLDAFSWMEKGDKSIRKELEDAYNVTADIGHIIKTLKQDGLTAIKHMKITPGIPIRPAAAERLSSAQEIVKKIGTCVAQPKLDGFRLQVHVVKHGHKKEVLFFSRNLQDMSHMFPELTEAAKELSVDCLVAEGEAIAYDVETGTFLPFQETVKRRRKYDIASTAQDIPLKLFLFDALYVDGTSLLDEPHTKRRKELLALFKGKEVRKDGQIILPLEEEVIEKAEELEKYFKENISSGLEGVVVKKIDSIYQPGKRNFNWIKLKREESGELEDTIDCVILGYYGGHGKRASFGIGALLVGVYNKAHDCFETIAKIGTGLSDDEWRAQKRTCDKNAVKEQPKNVVCAKELVPDVWVDPSVVCLIRADEITLSPLHSAGATKTHYGYALRFPRIMGYRPDKSALEATTINEIKRLYDLQFEKKSARGKKSERVKKVTGQKDIFE